MPRPIITLTTDFGLSDHYVGTMKGVILGIAPQASLVDISHDVQPFEASGGGFQVAQAYSYFPPKTVHVVVVDPGVGTARRPLLMEAAGQYFVAPDNGVLGMVFGREKHKVRHITAERFFLPQQSATFHGRDVFAPCAAHLAMGKKPSAFGRIITDYMRPTPCTPYQTARRVWVATVLHVDRFGNLITNLHVREFPDLEERSFAIVVGMARIGQVSRTFAEIPAGQPGLIQGSSGYYEIVVNQGSAARTLGCGTGAPVELTFY
ncbi:MAG: SAM-dependent chlorinase/fluorinase [Bryobacteraceae bacterium]